MSFKGQLTGKMQIPATLETPLTGPQERFVQAMARGLDKSAACREAGYGSRSSAYRAMRLPNVAARLAELKSQTAARNRICIDQISERLLEIVARTKDGATAAELNLARQALMDLAKLHGLLRDRLEVAAVTEIREIRRTIVDPAQPALPPPAPGGGVSAG